MTTLIEQINSFHEYAVQEARNTQTSLTIDELYNRWRRRLDREETIRAVRRGMEQIERGESMSLDELRRRVNENIAGAGKG